MDWSISCIVVLSSSIKPVKRLLILRHGKSSWDNPNLPDHDRPLAKRGERDAPRIGRLIQAKNLIPELILSSTAKRAVRTAELVAKHCTYSGDILYKSKLYHALPASSATVLKDSGSYNFIMIVGHNPGLEDLLENLVGEYQRLPTAALAHVSLPISRWSSFQLSVEGVLENIWRPKELLE